MPIDFDRMFLWNQIEPDRLHQSVNSLTDVVLVVPAAVGFVSVAAVPAVEIAVNHFAWELHLRSHYIHLKLIEVAH